MCFIYKKCLLQMKNKLRRLSQALYEEGGGKAEDMSQLVANLTNTRAIKPFIPVNVNSPQLKFALNSLETVKSCKKMNRKSGSPADLMRRAIIAAGATGPLSNEPVRKTL